MAGSLLYWSVVTTLWHVQLFGGLRIQTEQRVLPPLPTQRAGLLLARLAANPQRTFSREELGEWLWPESAPELQHARLRGEVLAVRNALAKEVLVNSGKLRIGISESVTCDAAQFQSQLLTSVRARTPEERRQPLEAGIALYADEFLPGSYDSWAVSERERLKTAYYDLLRRYYLDCLLLGRSAQAEQAIKTLQLQFPNLSLPHTEASGARVQPAPTPSTNTRETSPEPILSLPENPFVGRQHEHQQLLTWSRGTGKRLLTLTGIGGIGKTRLALELARDCERPMRFVALAELRDAASLVPTLLRTLGVEPSPSPGTWQQQLTTHLYSLGEVVLVLDNAEQLVETVATLVIELLQSCHALRILVTSRCLLEVEWEQELSLEPLPEDDARTLFLERVRTQRPDFVRSPQDQHLTDNICRFLEGIPLSLELAAARAFVLGPRELQAQLSNRWEVLVSRRRDLPPRQRSLWATVEWSLELLPAETRRFFERLSVFVLPFSLEQASLLCDDSPVSQLETLRAHSLLQLQSQTESGVRFSQLATLRDFATRQLPPDDPVFGWHAAHFAQKGDTWLQALRTPQESAAIRDFTATAPEVQAALRWASRHDRLLTARLGRILGALYLRSGFLASALPPLQLAREQVSPHTELWAAIACEWAGLALDQRDPKAAYVVASEVHTWARQSGATLTEADALQLLGQAAMHAGNKELAQTHFVEAVQRYELLGELGCAARVYNNQGILHYPTATAREYLERALHLYRAVGDLRGIAAALNNLGALAQERQELTLAEECYRESLQIEAALGNVFGVARSANNLGEIARSQGALQSATQRFSLAQQLFHQLGHPFEQTALMALRTLPSLPPIAPLGIVTSSQLPRLADTIY